MIAQAPLDKSHIEEVKELRAKLARLRLQRLEVQKKQWKVTAMQTKWMEKLQELRQERSVVLEGRERLEALNALALRQLDAFAQLYAPNDCFHIWHAGPFATINGFRLGRLAADQVEWMEVNAALGQVALLLSVLAQDNAALVATRSVDLFPRGSYSQIARALSPADRERGVRQPLYNLYSDGSGFALFSRNTPFAKGLELLVAAVHEAGVNSERADPSFGFPHPIDLHAGGSPKVGGVSIIWGQVSDELWTRALKMLLTDVKWVVAWAAKHAATSASSLV